MSVSMKLLCERKMLTPNALLHVSGSAYKIVNKRAYHHGTMLISTKLDTLGDLLRTDKVNISLIMYPPD